MNLEQMAQEHADLARSITETNQSMAASTGMLAGYGDTIAALAGRTDLTEEEIASLKLAVEGMNDACGTSYTVAQDMDGAWQVMADGAIVAKDAVLGLIEAQKAQVRAEAEAANYKSTYEQLAKDAEAYASAQSDVTAKQEALNAKLDELGENRYLTTTNGVIDLAEAEQTALDAAKEGLAGVESQMGSTQSALNRTEEQMKLTAMAAAEGASEILKLVDGNLQMKAAVQQTGTDLVGFTQALQDMGFTAEQVAAMAPEQAAAMAQGWQGGTLEMIAACEKLGIEVPGALRTMGEQAQAEAEAAAHATGQSMATGLSAETEAVVGAALELTGLTRAQFDKMAAEAGVEGNEATAAFAQSIAAGAFESGDAAALNAALADEGFGSVNETGTGNEAASQYYQALGSARNQNASTRSGKADAQAAYDGISSKNGEFRTSGNHAGNNFADGLRGAIDAVTGAANFVIGAVASILQFSVPEKGPFSGSEQGGKRSGRHLVQNIAAGMLAGRTSLKAATATTAEALMDGLDRAIANLDVPAVDVPVALSLAQADLRTLSGFGFAAAMEDRSGRGESASLIKLDLSPVTDALERIEDQIEAATERTADAYRQPVEVKLTGRQIGRVIREHA